MHARKVSHKILDNAYAWMHTARRNALAITVLAAIDERRLSVTGLGRAIDSDAREKHCIKRADRLVGNSHLQRESMDVYLCFARLVIGAARRPVLLVDWSDLDAYKCHYLLRASVALDGRSLTLFEEIHTLSTKDKPKTHRLFLTRLKAILPEACRPIVVTDAGFKNPWFREVAKLGWDWVGRIRHWTLLRAHEGEDWYSCKTLYDKATSTPKYLGCLDLARSSVRIKPPG